MMLENNKVLLKYIDYSRKNFNKNRKQLSSNLTQNLFVFSKFYNSFHYNNRVESINLINSIYKNNLDIIFLYLIARIAVKKTNNIAVIQLSTLVYQKFSIDKKSKEGIIFPKLDLADEDIDADPLNVL